MVSSPAQTGAPQVRRPFGNANLYDVLDLILDKGIVVDLFRLSADGNPGRQQNADDRKSEPLKSCPHRF